MILPLDIEEISRQVVAYKELNPSGALLILVPEAEAPHISAIQQITREHNYPVCGAVFPALLDEQGFHQQGVALMPLAVCPSYAIVDMSDATQSPEQAMQRLVQALEFPEESGDRSTLCMLFDGMVPNISTLLDALYLQLADRVNYAGVNVGSETFQPVPCLFDNRQITQNAVLAMVLPCDKGAVLEHGYLPHSKGAVASGSHGNHVSHIDWQPAMQVYQQIAQRDYGVEVTRENFYEQAVHLPFGILRFDGEVLVRIPVAMEEDGSLMCVGEIPENALLTLVEAPAADTTSSVDRLAEALDTRRFNTLLLFYCAGRRMHMGKAAERELVQLAERVEGKRIVGALSLGEIGQSSKGRYPLFHNATMVACPWS